MSGSIFHPFVLDNAAGQETVVGIGSDSEKYGVGISSDFNVTGLMGVGTTNPVFKLDVDYIGGEDGIRILNRGTTSGATSMLRLGNDENINAAFLMLNSSGYGSIGGAYNLVLGHGLSRDIVFSTGGTEKVRITSNGHTLPGADNTFDLGGNDKRWRNIFTNDLQLSNKGKTNDVDGTWGDWTLQEGENKIFMINNRTGKKYSLKMEEE